MIGQILKTSLIALGAGFVSQLIQSWAGSQYFNDFLRANLVNILIALLAINSATMGIVLTKIRDLVEKHGNGDAFMRTRGQMLLAVREQIVLIAIGIVTLTISQSEHLSSIPYHDLFFGSCISAIFVYGMTILYDTAKGVLIIIDFK